MNTFSIAVSKRLREIGVEDPDAQFYWSNIESANWELVSREILCERVEGGDGWTYLEEGTHRGNVFPAYTLHDIFRLMPKIGEKMGWGFALECEYTPSEVAYQILDSFLSGDYPACEIKLLELLCTHVEKQKEA